MKKYEYLLFDADNTLFDFSRAEYLSFKHTAEILSDSFSEELYRAYSDINDALWKELEVGKITLDFLKVERFRRFLIHLGLPDDGMTLKKAESMRDTYMDTLAKQTCLIDEAEEVCRTLSRKYKMYIITNGISKIQRSRMNSSALRDYFDGMFVSEEIGCTKPKKEYFDHVLSHVGCSDLTKYLIIGDSLTSDCDGAINYGIDICRFNPLGRSDDGRKITYTIKKLTELYEIL